MKRRKLRRKALYCTFEAELEPLTSVVQRDVKHQRLRRRAYACLCDEESPTGLGTSGGGIDNDEEDYFQLCT
jgi:hypothetical protein